MVEIVLGTALAAVGAGVAVGFSQVWIRLSQGFASGAVGAVQKIVCSHVVYLFSFVKPKLSTDS